MMQLKSLINKLHFNNSNLCILLLATAIFIAFKMMYNTHGWVNSDSLLYFEQARLISNFKFNEAYQLFKWPFYSSILGFTHYFTHLNIQLIAQLWNAFFFGIFCLGFFKLILHIGGDKTTLLLSALLLFSNQYIVGDVLPMLLRDEGFWAAFIWGVFFFIRFYQNKITKDAYLFQVCFILATLFRIEAIIYLFTLPLILLADNTLTITNKFKLIFKCTNTVLLIAACILLSMTLGYLDIHHIGRLQELDLSDGRSQSIISSLREKSELFGKEVLGDYLDNYAMQSLLLSYFWIVILKILKNATGLFALLILATGKQGLKSIAPKAMQTFYATIITGVVIAYAIILSVSLLSSRYVVAVGIVLIILSSFSLQHLITNTQNKLIKYCIVSILGLMLIANLHDTHHIDLDREAVNYLSKINVDHASVFYDTENARYYAQQPYKNRMLETELVKTKIDNGQISDYKYVVVTVDKSQTDYELWIKNKLTQYKTIKIIYGWKQKTKAIIFKKTE